MSPTPSLTARLRPLIELGKTQEAFDLLYSEHHLDVARYIASRQPQEPLVDVCQEVWRSAFQALPRFRFDSMPLTWLVSIANRRLVDSHRTSMRHNRERDLDSREVLLAQCGFVPRPISSPGTRLDRKRRIQAVEKLFAGWNPDDRQAFELRFGTGMKPGEIVQMLSLEVSANTLSRRLLRLLERVRHAMNVKP